ncbi:MAG: class I SAM-dependent methyltransferase [Candidatus Hodarchaeota archaeon]
MNKRGEGQFINLPRFGARLYDKLTQVHAVQTQFKEIAQDLISNLHEGRLLDIGTGPGKLLAEINQLNSNIDLFGLDISESMVQQAKKNLVDIKVDLRQGNIQHTDYPDDFFDVISCTGSFYLWNSPETCLEEIHRILKHGCSAYLFETYKDYNPDDFTKALRANLQRENRLSKFLVPFFLKKQLRMTYQINEFSEIFERTKFVKSFTVDKITLAGLPIWLRIKLTKQ